MSPAVAATKRTPAAAVPIPEVQDALARREAADIERQDRLLKAYREAVTLAAEGKPIPSSVADAAVEAAHALGLKASRMDADVAAVRRVLAADAGIEQFRTASAGRQARAKDIPAEIRATQQRLRDLEAEASRLSHCAFELTAYSDQRRDVEKDFPHLFKPAADMDEKTWRHVRA
jgi:hypothetical protein